jgi:hypothetical protein
MWFIDLLKLIYEAVTDGKVKILLLIAASLGLSYGFWFFSKSIPDTALFTIGVCLVYCLIMLPSKIKAAISIDHGDSEDYRNKISPIVRYLLNKTILKLCASRSFVLEGHNGSANLANLSFLYMDITYLETSIENDWINFDYRNMSTGIFPCFNYLSREGSFIGSIEDLSKIDNKISHIVHSNGTEYMCIVSLNNAKNKCIGAVAITWTSKPILEDKEIEKEVEHLAEKLERILTIRLSDKELNEMLDA